SGCQVQPPAADRGGAGGGRGVSGPFRLPALQRVNADTRLPRVLAIAVIAALAVLALAGNRAWQALEVIRAEEHDLATRIAREEEGVRILRARIARLESDPLTLEATAREELGWVRPNDLVVIFERDPHTQRATGTPEVAATSSPVRVAPTGV